MESLGIDLKLIIAQLVNFGILLFLLNKFLYKPVVNMLEERETKINQGLKDAEDASKKLAEASNDSKKIQEKAYADAQDILKNAKEAASAEATEIVSKANNQADRTMKNAKEEASSLKDKTMLEAKKEISDVVILALDKIVDKELTAEQKEKLTSKAISNL
jgi:F-type H+-transporting ATPase subunit b